jgi:hypothetical protein
MKKLTEKQLEEGRGHLRAGDLNKFIEWVDFNKILIDKVVLRKTMQKVIHTDVDRAIKLFDVTFSDIEISAGPVKILLRAGFMLTLILLLFLGCLGGVVYLFKLIF